MAEFWLLRGCGGGGSESIKKGKLLTKRFVSDNVDCSSKNLWKIMFADVKAKIKQEIKDLVAYLQIFKYLFNFRSTFKTWNIIM